MHSLPVEVFEKWNARIGADYNYSENTTIGTSLTGAYYGNTMHSVIKTINNDINNNLTSSIRNSDEFSLRRNPGWNAYLKHAFSKKSELNVNVDYLLYTRVMSPCSCQYTYGYRQVICRTCFFNISRGHIHYGFIAGAFISIILNGR